jgi:hypothetical protein
MILLILGLVAAAVIPRFVYSKETRTNECASSVMLMNARLDMHFAKTGVRPTAAEIERLITADQDAFPHGMPKCPFGRPFEYDPATGHVIAHQH